MGTFNDSTFVEGEAINASALNTKAGSLLETPVNDLDESSIERHALSTQHLPTLSMSDLFSSGYEVVSPAAAGVPGNAEEYSNSLPMSAANTAYPYTYQTFDNTAPGGSTVAYYGETSTSGATHKFQGWRIPAYGNLSANAAELPLVSARNFNTERIKGVICRGSVEVYYGNLVGGTGAPPVPAFIGLNSLAIAIGWEDGLGNRHIVERSVRFYSVEACLEGNASAFCFLTQSDLLDGDLTCAKIFMAIATCRPSQLTAEGAARGVSYGEDDLIEIKFYNLSVTPLQAGDL